MLWCDALLCWSLGYQTVPYIGNCLGMIVVVR
jgi:hypothetical protein